MSLCLSLDVALGRAALQDHSASELKVLPSQVASLPGFWVILLVSFVDQTSNCLAALLRNWAMSWRFLQLDCSILNGPVCRSCERSLPAHGRLSLELERESSQVATTPRSAE